MLLDIEIHKLPGTRAWAEIHLRGKRGPLVIIINEGDRHRAGWIIRKFPDLAEQLVRRHEWRQQFELLFA